MDFSDRSLNKKIPVPLHYQLKELLIDELKKGTFKPGDPIPSESELSNAFQISRTTVRQALTALTNEGYFYRIRGKGTFIAKPKVDLHYMSSIESFNDQVLLSGMNPKTQVIEFHILPADAIVSTYLQIAMGSKVIRLLRVRYVENEAVAIADSFLPFDLCSYVLDHDMSLESLYKIFSTKEDTKVVKVIRTVEAKVANEADSKLLQIKKGFPVQHFLTVAFNNDERPVEYCESIYRGDRSKFTVEIHREFA